MTMVRGRRQFGRSVMGALELMAGSLPAGDSPFTGAARPRYVRGVDEERRHDSRMAYNPIEDYGLIGNMHTAALVGKDGSIDWLCMPHFDSPSVFARMLDDRKGGHFRVAPVAASDDHVTCKQIYWPDSNVLISRFLGDEGV